MRKILADRGYAGPGVEHHNTLLSLQAETGSAPAVLEDVAVAGWHAASCTAYCEFVHDKTVPICSDTDA
jgi:hypothetical protein